MMTDFKWDVKAFETHLGFVSELVDEIVSWLDPQQHERILDIGCGDGRLTARLAKQSKVIEGLEPDPNMASEAIGYGVKVHQIAARDMIWKNEFDAIFSNATFHWIKRPEIVLDRCYEALKPGGRLVVEQGGEANLASLRAAIRACLICRDLDADMVDVWDLPSIRLQKERLKNAGFTVEKIQLVCRSTLIKSDFSDWFKAFELVWLSGVKKKIRRKIRVEVEAALEGVVIDTNGRWNADYVRLRYLAVKNI